jgi:gamma-glutamyltranspeptidase
LLQINQIDSYQLIQLLQLFANDIRSRITNSAHPTAYYGGDFAPINDHGTTHITVMDADGNAVSVTSTINLQYVAD